jgi:MFS family permease
MSPEPPARGVLTVLLLGSTLTVMAGAILAPVVHLIRTELDISTAAAGFVLTAHALAIAVVSPLVGGIIDRHGVRRPLAVGLLLYGLGGGAGALTDSYPLLIAGRIVFGVGAAVVFTGTTVALLTLYHGPQRDRVMGWRSTATSLGGVIWPLAGGAAGILSWQAPFAIYVVGVPLGLATLHVLPDRRPVDDTGTAGESQDGLRLWRRPALLGYCGLFTVLSLLLYTLLVLLPARLAELGVTSTVAVALVTATNSVAMSLAGLGYARLRSRHSYVALLRAACTAWTIAFCLLGTADHMIVIVAATMLFGLGAGVAVPALTTLVTDFVSARLRGRITAVTATFTFAGQPLAPLVVGPLVDLTTTRTGFLAAAGLAAAVLLGLLSSRRDQPPPRRTAPGSRSIPGRRSA